MRLFIAEKPSVGRAIAAVLPGPAKRENGYIRCADNTLVSWCIGHLLEPAEPAAYDPRWRRWCLSDLPLFPPRWQLIPKTETGAQLDTLCQLIGGALEIIHAGDPDREGQLLVDEILRFCRARQKVLRLLINDLNPDAIARALDGLVDNARYRRLSHSALARQQADWLYGINMTRACTLRHRDSTGNELYSVGRVQTPVLGLVVKRDIEIEAFQARAFYVPVARLVSEAHGGPEFDARWQADNRGDDHAIDAEGRLLDRALGERICADAKGNRGTVTEARFHERREAPPLPLSLSALQIEAARRYRLNAQEVLSVAQDLYEKYRLVTYPRSDCRYLPESQFSDREAVIEAVGANAPELAAGIPTLDSGRRSRAWNDAAIDAHHAIIPTRRRVKPGSLSQREADIYGLIARHYLMQFAPDALHREGKLVCQLGEACFRATESALITPGWHQLEASDRAPDATTDRAPLPRLRQGDPVLCSDSRLLERRTQPPNPFTDATLLSAMTGISRFVADPHLKKTLRETDGLGTEATRAGIIETLFRRGYLTRDKRFIRSTGKGRQLVQALPDTMVAPDMTALWEAALENIRLGAGNPRDFLNELKVQIAGLLNQVVAPTAPNAPHCPRCRAPMQSREGRFGSFWACSRFPQCEGTRNQDASAQTEDGAGVPPVPCPSCHAPLRRKQGRRGWFWGCSNFPSCRQTVDDRDGVPDVN